jgi:hypothetical protein
MVLNLRGLVGATELDHPREVMRSKVPLGEISDVGELATSFNQAPGAHGRRRSAGRQGIHPGRASGEGSPNAATLPS